VDAYSVFNCGLTASAKIYVLPDALRGWRQHWCNGLSLRQVGTVSWRSHRFLPRTLCVPPSLVGWPVPLRCGMHLREQRHAEFAEGNHECSLYQLREHHSSHIGKPIQISARFSLPLVLIFGGIRGTACTVWVLRLERHIAMYLSTAWC
jgi:hypothetical protein